MSAEQGIFNLYKQSGETPLERLLRFKSDHPKYEDVPMTYAGRLDPMAEGVLLVLAGEERLKREEYLKLPKVYEFEILWGFESDSYDQLGIVRFLQEPENVAEKVRNVLPKFIGHTTLPYPPYSSRTVDGVPLFKLAREGKVDAGDLPLREVEIKSLEILGEEIISTEKIEQTALEKISHVRGDFRQNEITFCWEEIGRKNNGLRFPITKFKAEVSSGTYIRSLSHSFGEELGCGALAWNIKRTAVGDYAINDAQR